MRPSDPESIDATDTTREGAAIGRELRHTQMQDGPLSGFSWAGTVDGFERAGAVTPAATRGLMSGDAHSHTGVDGFGRAGQGIQRAAGARGQPQGVGSLRAASQLRHGDDVALKLSEEGGVCRADADAHEPLQVVEREAAAPVGALLLPL
eukprot:3961826-Prymnesium_polylepis.1